LDSDDSANDSDSDDIASGVSSDDSDVAEIEQPLVPEWASFQNVQTKVGNKVNSFLVSHGLEQSAEQLKENATKTTRQVAEKSLESAEWVLEKTGQGVTWLSSLLYVKLNKAVNDLVTNLGNTSQISTTNAGAGAGEGGSQLPIPPRKTPGLVAQFSPPPAPAGPPPNPAMTAV
jgi:hypothetical protein